MAQLLKDLAPVLSWLITSGALLGALRSIHAAVRAKRAGVAVRDGKRRLDVVAQRDAALAYAHQLREYCLSHGTRLTDLPEWPPHLKETR